MKLKGCCTATSCLAQPKKKTALIYKPEPLTIKLNYIKRMRQLFLALFLCSLAFAGFAQCVNTNTVYSYNELTAPTATNGTATMNDMRPGEYLPINGVVAGYQYKVTSSVATNYLTVRSGVYNGLVAGQGVQSVTFIAAISGTYYVHLNTDANCGTTSTVNSNVTITLLVPTSTPAGCFNTSQLRSFTAPDLNGTSTAFCMVAGTYAPVSNVVSTKTYKFTSTIATDYISVRSGTYNGAIVAAGVQPLTFVAPIDGKYYVHINSDANCGVNNSCRDVTLTQTYPVCTGTPSLGNATTTNLGPVCSGTLFRVGMSTPLQQSNLSYQWEFSTVGATGPFTAIAGKTKDTANIANQTQTSWYRLKATCIGSGQSALSEAVQVTQQAAANCYCVPTYSQPNQNAYINSVQLGTINNITGRNAAAPNNYYKYTSAPAANQTTNLAQGASATIVIGFPTNLVYSTASAWIDFNADGDFTDPGEKLGGTNPDNISPVNATFSFTIPATATPGPTRLRVRAAYYTAVPDPCATVYSDGETEDYTVTIAAPCTGSLALGSATTSNAGPVCSSTSFNLSVDPAPVPSDITYEWQVSTAGASGPYSDIPAQTGPTATITGQTRSSWYRLKSFCTSSGQSDFSSAVQVTQQAAANCYCTPEIGFDNGLGYINSVQLGTINNVSGQNYVGPQDQRIFYFSYTSTPAANQTTNLAQGSSQTITIDVAGDNGNNSVAAWIDFNGDGDFYDAGEQLGAAANLPNGTVSFTFTVPATAVPGPTRLRIRESRMVWYYPDPVKDPCEFMKTFGESEDYTVSITGPCTGSNITLYRDADGDGFGNPAITSPGCSSAALPPGWVANNTDCDDKDANKHGSYNFYADQDGDGYGIGSPVSVCAVDAATPPTGYSLNGTDCNDDDKTVWRTATFYRDEDGDGFTIGDGLSLCYGDTAPAGYSSSKSAADDCNDQDAGKWQSATLYVDNDGDSFTTGDGQSVCYGASIPAGFSGTRSSSDDCDDADNTKWRSEMLYVDNDGDGYTTGNPVMVCYGTTILGGYGVVKSAVDDCNDTDATVWQGQNWYQDADGDHHAGAVQVSCNKPSGSGWTTNTLPEGDCNDADNKVWHSGTFYRDADSDGYTTGSGVTICYGLESPVGYQPVKSAADDCNDNDNTVWQSKALYIDADADRYDNGTQTVCYGTVAPAGYALSSQGHDCNDNDRNAWRSGTFYRDQDGDGYTVGSAVTMCYGEATPTGYKTTGSATPDCDDTNSAIGAALTWYLDADGDGYYTGSVVVSCTAPGMGYKSSGLKGAGDCNDADQTIYPGAPEICGDGKDNNCNGLRDEGCTTALSLSINDVTVYESQGTAQLTVTLSAKSTQAIKVNFASQDGTAVTTGKYKDYKAVKGTLTIAAGSMTGTITIPILKDNLVEGDQYFNVLLSKPTSGVTFTNASGRVTIKDGAPTTVTLKAASSVEAVSEKASALSVQALPNPSANQFTLIIKSALTKPVIVQITDALGRRVEAYPSVPSNSTLRFGGNYRPGMYLVQVMQGTERTTLKLVKQAN